MIRKKYGSLWKRRYNVSSGRTTNQLERGVFDIAINYARRHRGGLAAIEHIKSQPWESWRVLR